MTKIQRLSVLGVLFSVGLACGGGDGVTSEVPEPAPAPAPTVEAPLAQEGPLVVFSLHPAAGGCLWQMWEGQLHDAGKSKSCPTEILWNPDGKSVLVSMQDGLVSRPWSARGLPPRDPGAKPEHIAEPPWPESSFDAPWVADNGKLRMVALVSAKAEKKGNTVVFEAGELSVSTVDDGEGAVKYGVRGNEVTAPGQGDRDVWLPPWGLDYLAVFYERTDDGAWTRLTALPTRDGAGDTPGTLVGGHLLDRANWPAMTTLVPGGVQEAPEEWQSKDDLKAALHFEEGDQIGFVPSGDGGLLYRISWGDTPHASPPVFWCLDATCSKRSEPLSDLPDDNQLGIAVRAGHAVISKEYSGAAARLYAAGKAEPVFSWADAEIVALAPAGGFPGQP